MQAFQIRKSTPDDDEGLLALLRELQDHERQFEPQHLPGEKMAHEYLPHLKDQCRDHDGCIFVAESDRVVIGFVCVWRGEQLSEYMSEPFEIAYVSDLIVRKSHRGGGVGSSLLLEAERFAMSKGLRMIKIGSLARNYHAKERYRKWGYRDYAIQLIKELPVTKR